jgi:23S rRNA (pseudouridine1915-N3)-methyltransferase
MQLLVAAVGRLKQGPERDLALHYAKRIEAAGPGIAIGPMTLTELVESRAATADLRKADEAERLLTALAKAETLIVLDETGKPSTSRQFADTLGKLRDEGCARLGFALGGPDGHAVMMRSPLGHARTVKVMSLGPMTLPHGLARIILLEQIYRSVTLLSGHPYHRD